jgi:HK97 family phage portal protein
MAAEAIGMGMAAEEFGAKFYKNNASIGGTLEIPTELSTTAYDRLKKSWTEKYQGLKNSSDTAILEGGTKFNPLNIPHNQAQFIETRKFQKQEIAMIFDLPPHMIGDLDKATFSNIEELFLQYLMGSIQPWVVRWEQRLNMQLLSPEERKAEFYFKFNMSALMRGNYAARMTGYSTGIQWGIYSPNECREMEDKNPYDGGDIYLSPLNMMNILKINEQQKVNNNTGNK